MPLIEEQKQWSATSKEGGKSGEPVRRVADSSCRNEIGGLSPSERMSHTILAGARNRDVAGTVSDPASSRYDRQARKSHPSVASHARNVAVKHVRGHASSSGGLRRSSSGKIARPHKRTVRHAREKQRDAAEAMRKEVEQELRSWAKLRAADADLASSLARHSSEAALDGENAAGPKHNRHVPEAEPSSAKNSPRHHSGQYSGGSTPRRHYSIGSPRHHSVGHLSGGSPRTCSGNYSAAPSPMNNSPGSTPHSPRSPHSPSPGASRDSLTRNFPIVPQHHRSLQVLPTVRSEDSPTALPTIEYRRRQLGRRVEGRRFSAAALQPVPELRRDPTPPHSEGQGRRIESLPSSCGASSPVSARNHQASMLSVNSSTHSLSTRVLSLDHVPRGPRSRGRTTVSVSSLPTGTTLDILRDAFAAFGLITSIEWANGGQKAGVARISFSDARAARHAVSSRKAVLGSRRAHVAYADALPHSGSDFSEPLTDVSISDSNTVITSSSDLPFFADEPGGVQPYGLCAACGLPTSHDGRIKALTRYWHTQCLTCSRCAAVCLDGCFVETDNAIYCPTCSERLCTACKGHSVHPLRSKRPAVLPNVLCISCDLPLSERSDDRVSTTSSPTSSTACTNTSDDVLGPALLPAPPTHARGRPDASGRMRASKHAATTDEEERTQGVLSRQRSLPALRSNSNIAGDAVNDSPVVPSPPFSPPRAPRESKDSMEGPTGFLMLPPRRRKAKRSPRHARARMANGATPAIPNVLANGPALRTTSPLAPIAKTASDTSLPDESTEDAEGVDTTEDTTDDEGPLLGDNEVALPLVPSLNAELAREMMARSSSRDALVRSSSRDGVAKSSSRDGAMFKSSSREGVMVKSSSRDGLIKSSSRDGVMVKSSSREGLVKSNSRDGGMVKSSSREGLMKSDSRDGGLVKSSSRDGLVKSSSRDGLVKSSSRDGLVKGSARDGVMVKSGSREGVVRVSSPRDGKSSNRDNGMTRTSSREALKKEPKQEPEQQPIADGSESKENRQDESKDSREESREEITDHEVECTTDSVTNDTIQSEIIASETILERELSHARLSISLSALTELDPAAMAKARAREHRKAAAAAPNRGVYETSSDEGVQQEKRTKSTSTTEDDRLGSSNCSSRTASTGSLVARGAEVAHSHSSSVLLPGLSPPPHVLASGRASTGQNPPISRRWKSDEGLPMPPGTATPRMPTRTRSLYNIPAALSPKMRVARMPSLSECAEAESDNPVRVSDVSSPLGSLSFGRSLPDLDRAYKLVAPVPKEPAPMPEYDELEESSTKLSKLDVEPAKQSPGRRSSWVPTPILPLQRRQSSALLTSSPASPPTQATYGDPSAREALESGLRFGARTLLPTSGSDKNIAQPPPPESLPLSPPRPFPRRSSFAGHSFPAAAGPGLSPNRSTVVAPPRRMLSSSGLGIQPRAPLKPRTSDTSEEAQAERDLTSDTAVYFLV